MREWKPNAKALRHWMHDVEPHIVDSVLEFLHDEKMLTKKGEILGKEFWRKYIKSKS